MAWVRGRILEGKTVVIEDIELWLELVVDSGEMKEWHGTFDPSTRVVECGRTYRLQLADGRSGEIILNRLEMAGRHGWHATFQGTGPLE
jgi:hypothetical protein